MHPESLDPSRFAAQNFRRRLSADFEKRIIAYAGPRRFATGAVAKIRTR